MTQPIPVHTLSPSLIEADALPRDRGTDDAGSFSELVNAILLEGLRQPIEVFELAEPTPDGARYGLISGFRRLAAIRHLAHDTIAAFIRNPQSVPEALAAMVSENETRSQISPWDKARLVVTCLHRDLFATADAALDGLYPMLSRQKRSRMRGHVLVVETFGTSFATPERLSVAQLDRLAAALRSGWDDVLCGALPGRGGSLDSQWAALVPILDEALNPAHPAPNSADAPRRVLHLPNCMTIRRELTRTGWILRFSGPEAKSPGLIDDVFTMIDGMLGNR